MLKRIILVITLVSLCGYDPAFSSDLGESAGAPLTPIEQSLKRCSEEFNSHILKTNLAMGKCMMKASDETIKPAVINQQAYADASNQFLLLMIQEDKKQVSPEEAKLQTYQIWRRFDEAENVVKQTIASRNEVDRQQTAAHEQAEQQRQNLLYRQLLGAAAQPFNAQRQWVDQQNQNRQIHCTSIAGETNCQQY